VPHRDAAISFEVFCFFLFYEEKKLVFTVLFMTLVVSIEMFANGQRDGKA
jgi:hypothetical protein